MVTKNQIDSAINATIDDDTFATASATSTATSESVAAYANLSRKNIIIGSNFTTNPWQRGTTFTGIATGAFGADRFAWDFVGTTVVDFIKATDAPTVAEAGIFSVECLHIDVTTADAAIAASAYDRVIYTVEGYDWTALAQREFTISFWVKATKVGIYCVAFTNSGADRSYVAEYTVDVTDTWEKKTVTVSASPSAGTWDYGNGAGIVVSFTMASGTDFHTTADAWQTGDFMATSNQVNGVDNAANNFKLQLIQLEAGGAVTPFEIRHRGQELALCQRYYDKSFPQGTTPATGTGIAGSVGYRCNVSGVMNASVIVSYKSTLRAAPTVVYYNPTNANTNWYNFSRSLDSGATSDFNTSANSISIGNAQIAGDVISGAITVHYTADAEI